MIEGLIPRGTNEDRRDEADKQVLHISEFNREAHVLFSVLHPVSDTGCAAQLVKSARRGIPKTTQRRREEKETRTKRSEMLIAY